MVKGTYAYGLGRRKSATARARLYNGGKGNITVNDKPAAEYFADATSLLHDMVAPLKLLEKQKTYDITVVVRGGGHSGQIDAIKLAISKALAGMSDDNRSTLKKAGLLKRDPREKERKKPGLKRARKAEQYTKR